MIEPTCLKDVGVDYLTITTNDKVAQTGCHIRCDRIQKQLLKEGEKLRPWTMSGFSGYSAGALQYGWRDDALIVRLSSKTAWEHWRWFGERATNCSRLDLQATFEYSVEPSSIIRTHLRQMKRWRKGRERPPSLALYADADGPATLYLGKRVSDRFGRIYNKAAESGLSHYEGCVRYELELKNDLAWYALKALLSAESVDTWVLAQVLRYFADRGGVVMHPTRGTLPVSSPRQRSNALKKLTWLRESVRFVLESLLESGYEKEVVAALALPDSVAAKIIGPSGP